MAAVVSHAMRRFPPSDIYSPYGIRGESSHQVWSEFEGDGSALERSMRYSNPWLYGTVRAPAGVLLTAPAFVLCTCPDYLNGTKQASKKGPTICKKCKGTRVPLSSGDVKFGTVRCYPTATATTSAPIRAGTVRVSGSSSRPSILPSGDPYDLVRKSRLENGSGGGGRLSRARSTSPPVKTTGRDARGLGMGLGTVRASSSRKSILECSINPYELMETGQGSEGKGIKLVNGQRIRVAPVSNEQEYEDVQVKKPHLQQQHQQQHLRQPSDPPRKPPPKPNEKESDSNRFKSILKKPTTTFSDTDSHNGGNRERSPSPTTPRSGSHFYLPLPGTTPRKKVQFLVENKEKRGKEPEEVEDYDDVEVSEENVGKEEEEVEKENEKDETDKKPISILRRSTSERTQQEQPKVIFHDSMALRSRSTKEDSRNLFQKEIQLPKETPTKTYEKTKFPDVTTIKEPITEEITEPQNPIKIQDDSHLLLKTETEPPMAPPRKRSNSKIPVVQVTTPPVTDVPKVEADPPNKTVVTISLPKPIHKLQIKNDYVDTEIKNGISLFDAPQRKTSILINGDDCYSTVNVSDDIPLYQSSVVVKDTRDFVTIGTVGNKSSKIYITGTFISVPEEPILDLKPTTETSKSEDGLDVILKDPVEAVKRNLVPHVCGKSDMKWRHDSSNPSLLDDQNSRLLAESLLRLEDVNPQEEDVSSENSSSTQYELMDPGSDCYTDTSNRSSVTEEELSHRNKFYELLAESAVEVSETEDHHYESIKNNSDPIYEEIEIPPPLPSNPPPVTLVDDLQLDKEFTTRSIFEGASKYDILSYLVDAKERGLALEDSFTYNLPSSPTITDITKPYSRGSHLSNVSDSSEDNSLILAGVTEEKMQKVVEVERNDSGVGSETSKSSLSKYRNRPEPFNSCEDCEVALELDGENEPLVCRKCLKRRSERKEIITEIVETEEKYSRDLQIILEEFYQPMLVAGLLTPEQLSAIFLNVEELLENSQVLAEKLRDAVEIAVEQGDEDLLTVNIGKLFLEAAPMLHAFESYCVRQGPASLLLASLEKDKELLRIFLRVSQMENTLLRRMNLNSFLMVPVQRVTKYPLLLARLYKVTPAHHETREQLKEAQTKIELHLNHMNSETKDVPSKLWRRISNNSGRRSSAEMDLVNIKLRKIAVDVLEWNHDEAKFTLEGKLLYTQPADNNWRKGRTIKLTPINALLVTNGKVPTPGNSRSDRSEENGLIFSKHSSIREAALLLVRDKNGRYSLLREPLYLDRCVIAADPAWQSYFEVQEILGKDTFIFKAEDDELTNTWYRQLQFHAQGLGTWRKRRNALANIMINGMGLRS